MKEIISGVNSKCVVCELEIKGDIEINRTEDQEIFYGVLIGELVETCEKHHKETRQKELGYSSQHNRFVFRVNGEEIGFGVISSESNAGAINFRKLEEARKK